MAMFLISHHDSKKFICDVLSKMDVADGIASLWADMLVETSLLGFDSHGIRMLARYVGHIEGGGVLPSSQPTIISQTSSCAVMDAKFGLGHISAWHATQECIKCARKCGLACVTVHNANHVGACGLYTRMAALSDCVGMFTTVSRACIAPWGGLKPLVGNNAISVAAPVANKPPFLFDVASSVVAMGKITAAMDHRQPIPPNWALDAFGNGTTDPADAANGTLLPIGDHKGYGLAMAIEVLTSLLSGGLLSCEMESWIKQTQRPTGASFTIVVFDIKAFGDSTLFRNRMSKWVDTLISSPCRSGFDAIYYPGLREAQTRELRTTKGIPLHSIDVQMLRELGDKFDVTVPETEEFVFSGE